jgi:hypothetical protein
MPAGGFVPRDVVSPRAKLPLAAPEVRWYQILVPHCT